MSERPINCMLDKTMQKIKEMVDVNTIIGTPINLSNGTIIVPVSKVSYGFASGGSEFSNKKENSENLFGGGSGAGVTVSPVAFLISNNNDTKLLRLEPSNNSVDRVIEMLPDAIDKIGSCFGNKKDLKDSKDLKD